jgi:hypothetical protein
VLRHNGARGEARGERRQEGSFHQFFQHGLHQFINSGLG